MKEYDSQMKALGRQVMDYELALKSKSEIAENQLFEEIQSVRFCLQELTQAREDFEKQTETIINKLLEKDENSIDLKDSTGLLGIKENSQKSTIESFKLELQEFKELSKVFTEIQALIGQVIKEKQFLQSQVENDLIIKQNIDKSLKFEQETPKEILITKIKYLEHELNNIESIMSKETKQNNSLIYQQLRQINSDSVEEKIMLQEKAKLLENELKAYQDDFQMMLKRVEEAERENYELRSKGDKNLAEEKMKLLQEVEEIKKREEVLEKKLNQKLENELYKIQNEQEQEWINKVIIDVFSILQIDQQANDYKDFLRIIEERINSYNEKFNILLENKDLMMQERLLNEERLQEVLYENNTLTNQINNFQQEANTLRHERDQLNNNSNILATKFREVTCELMDIKEEKSQLLRQNKEFKDIIEQLDRKASYHMPFSQSKPPIPISPNRPIHQESLMTNSLDNDNQLSSLIQDYKSENQKFSQRMQELQEKLTVTSQGSPQRQNSYRSAQSFQSAQKIRQQTSSFNTVNSQRQSSVAHTKTNSGNNKTLNQPIKKVEGK